MSVFVCAYWHLSLLASSAPSLGCRRLKENSWKYSSSHYVVQVPSWSAFSPSFSLLTFVLYIMSKVFGYT